MSDEYPVKIDGEHRLKGLIGANIISVIENVFSDKGNPAYSSYACI